MTTCILSGFDRAKKYIGGIYACDGSDIPATQDFGTVQFSGPYEAAQTVPATTVTYTIIGKTPCGDTVRRITTKTYSSRSAANSWKVSYHATLITGGGNPGFYAAVGTPADLGAFIGYGATAPLANDNLFVKAYAVAPVSIGFIIPPTPGSKQARIVDSQYIYYSPCPVTDPGALYNMLSTPSSQTNLTLYYIDVNEVWTYDLV